MFIEVNGQEFYCEISFGDGAKIFKDTPDGQARMYWFTYNGKPTKTNLRNAIRRYL